MNFRQRNRSRAEADLDMTPLIDVVFLLLIFFLVTAAYATQDQTVIPVELPQGTSGEAAAADERVSVVLQRDARVRILYEGEEELVDATPEALRGALRGVHARSPDAAVFLRGDRDVSYGEIMEVLDVARTIGFPTVYNVVDSSP